MYQYSKLFSVLSYLTWIGWILAFVQREKDDELVRHHLNQALILNIAGIILWMGGVALTSFIPFGFFIEGPLQLVLFAFTILGIIRAIQMSTEPLPLIGNLKLF